MLQNNEGRPHVEGRRSNRVSSAVWPLKVRKVVATGKAAQRRRDWIIQGRWEVVLADALAKRVLLIPTTLLVVLSSLLVAFLGLHFWYLLLFPLLLFAALLTIPAFIASRRPVETLSSPLSTLAELKSFTGILSSDVQERKSQLGILSAESNQDILSGETPLTPMPVAQPLIRVLETYDLRSQPGEFYLTTLPGEDYGEHSPMYSREI